MLLAQKAERIKTPKQITMLDAVGKEAFGCLTSPRVLNCHLFFGQLPIDFVNRKCKIIHIVRNPKDIAVSFFHHHKGITCYEYDGNWEDYLPRFLKGDGNETGRISCYNFQYLGSWYFLGSKFSNFYIFRMQNFGGIFLGLLEILVFVWVI